MEFAKSYNDLTVYKLQRQLSKEIFEISKSFPKEEKYSLTDQLRRSVRSIGAQIAEAWGKRKYEKHFVSKLTDADAEQLETRHWIDTASDSLYISQIQQTELLTKCALIENMLHSMINKAHLFCK